VHAVVGAAAGDVSAAVGVEDGLIRRAGRI